MPAANARNSCESVRTKDFAVRPPEESNRSIWVADKGGRIMMVTGELAMSRDDVRESLERALSWARQHPITVTTAAVLLLAALALPLTRSSGPPAADLGPDETPLFV